MLIIQNWSVCNPRPDPYQAPEAQRKYLQGKVYGHPDFEDGAQIVTSELTGYRKEGERFFGVCRKREYALGEVDPGYLMATPGLWKRLEEQCK